MADDRYETLLANYRNAWVGLRMIREAVETLGPPGVLPSDEAVISASRGASDGGRPGSHTGE